jgi:hypothetical protein
MLKSDICIHSGIGPRQHLEEHGIEVVLDMPGVGSELVCYSYFFSKIICWI